ncbi:MAG: DUF3014 domain-containing protein [Betaproteobacteria bacterium]|nr:MAG: DUF3014 domain-containing protein [Betaproteobacteria bacterium]
MEPRTLEDDRPYLRPEEPSALPWFVAALVIVLAGGIGYYYYYYLPAQRVPAAPVAKTEPAPAPQPAKPAIANPLPQSEAKSLPTLENSDSMMRESLAGLLGSKAFNDFIIPTQLVRRIVATVDNLPRRSAPRRVMPVHPVAGAFRTAGSREAPMLDPANTARYAAYVRAMETVPARPLVETYVQTYPLFQRAYEELGHPGKYFNDRLLEAIDDLLAAPEVGTPVRLIQPKVLYEFADPELETRSAGQKILIRMGGANALKVKAKLREIRQELAAAGAKKS